MLNLKKKLNVSMPDPNYDLNIVNMYVKNVINDLFFFSFLYYFSLH